MFLSYSRKFQLTFWELFKTCQTSAMKPFKKIVNSPKQLTIFGKRHIIDISQDPKYALWRDKAN